MKAIILNSNEWGGNCTDEHIENNESLFLDFFFTDVLPNNNIIKKIWNGSEWTEGATPEEIEDYNRSLVPEEISRMKFETQVLLTTGIEWDGIIAYIIDLSMSELYKKLLLIRLKRCVTLKREDNDLNTIAFMMGITQQQLDEIFINGNLLD